MIGNSISAAQCINVVMNKNDFKSSNESNGKSPSKTKYPDRDDIQFEEKAAGSTSSKESHSKKKKPKVIDITTPTLLKGRYCCYCETKKHALINNCLNCGRIVCEQEGSGPCYFCGNLVCTPEEQAQLKGDTAKGAKLYNQLLMKKKPKGLEEALEHRDKLLNYEKNTLKHTHVFDDDSDYFCASNPWLTLEQREQMKKDEEEFFNKKYESQKNKKITLDLRNRKILNEDGKVNRNTLLEKANNTTVDENITENIVDHLIDPFFASFDIKFEKTLKSNLYMQPNLRISDSRIMDTEIQHVVDIGNCMSIHQPWATFLVHGIKTAEGRTWYTSFRGKLWIASSNARVPRSEIEKCENTYRLIKENVNFPKDYPCGCLLGCVDLVDCLTQEQYRHDFPDGEIEDPYVFICENPQILSVRYPIRGKPNIYKLDEKIHKAAALSLKMI